jgi:rhamnogalacturonyl hydrolase YesR
MTLFRTPTLIIALAGLAGSLPLQLRGEATSRALDETDTGIRRVLDVVSRRQVVPLRDGDYQPVDSVASALAARRPEGIMWSYQWGVVLYGAIRSTDVTGDQRVLDFALEHNRIVARYYAWLAATGDRLRDSADWLSFTRDNSKVRLGHLLLLGDLDSTGSMGSQILEGMLRRPADAAPEQKAVVARVADWIVNRQERLPDGTFWRPDLPGAGNIWRRNAIWADDLYMSCPFLVRWAQYTRDSRHLDDAARQIINMAGRLQDSDGLWYHAWFESEKNHSPFKWGRANGWVMVSTVEVLSALPEDHPDRPALLDILRRHIEGVKAVQPPSGVWRQVLDHPELWEETSCTAMFAYSIARAVNRGWSDPSNMAVARKAFAGLAANYVTPAGVVKGTCQGTGIGLTLDYYANRKRPDDDLHARGVVLLAGAEILAAVENSRGKSPGFSLYDQK